MKTIATQQSTAQTSAAASRGWTWGNAFPDETSAVSRGWTWGNAFPDETETVF